MFASISNILMFNLQLHQNDTVIIFDGVDNDSNILFNKTNSHISRSTNIIASSTNVIFVYFLSTNITDNRVPLIIHHHPFCEEWIDMNSNYLKSPNYPYDYDNNVTCTWEITTSSEKYINLKFSTFDVNKLNSI